MLAPHTAVYLVRTFVWVRASFSALFSLISARVKSINAWDLEVALSVISPQIDLARAKPQKICGIRHDSSQTHMKPNQNYGLSNLPQISEMYRSQKQHVISQGCPKIAYMHTYSQVLPKPSKQGQDATYGKTHENIVESGSHFS